MTDREFEILDELYFKISYTELKFKFQDIETELPGILYKMYERQWIRCMDEVENEILNASEEEFNTVCQNCFFFASKKGLLAHNTL